MLNYHDIYVNAEYINGADLGGVGGCPYAPGASGNVATDDLNHFLNEMGISTNIDQSKLFEATQFIQKKLNKPISSHVFKVMEKA
ncbi:hypothetical protein ABE042_01635 [Viridibacillus arvi]